MDIVVTSKEMNFFQAGDFALLHLLALGTKWAMSNRKGFSKLKKEDVKSKWTKNVLRKRYVLLPVTNFRSPGCDADDPEGTCVSIPLRSTLLADTTGRIHFAKDPTRSAFDNMMIKSSLASVWGANIHQLSLRDAGDLWRKVLYFIYATAVMWSPEVKKCVYNIAYARESHGFIKIRKCHG